MRHDVLDTFRPLPFAVTLAFTLAALLVAPVAAAQVPEQPAISIEKFTNGQEADTPPGPILPVGSPVLWAYVVVNIGDVPLLGVIVVDDRGVSVSCPKTALAPGESMTCTGSGMAMAGQYVNVGSAVAISPAEVVVSASDPSHYFGQSLSFDFGDAPAPYPTLLGSNGARHATGGPVFLGACVDAEPDGFPGAGASGDDGTAGTATGACVTAGDDEDGVAFTTPLVAGATAGVEVLASAPCVLSAFVDFALDGDWDDAGDSLFPGGTALVAGANPLTFTVPASAAAGTTFARFRCTTAGAVGFTGEAGDGEVEDLAVELLPAPPSVSATKSAALQGDGNGDGLAGAGDTLRYTIAIVNDGPGEAVGVVFADTPGTNTTLVAGSVTTTAGTVASGNAAGDSTVEVTVGTLAPLGGSAVIAFDVVVDDPLAPGVRQVSNAGTVTGSNFPTASTDDAALPGPADPTVTALAETPAVVPVLGGAGLWTLLALVALAGARKLAG